MSFPTGAAVRNDNIMGSVIAPDVDYSALAVPFGGHAQRVTRVAELGSAIRSALAALRDGRFALLDVHVSP